MMSSELEKLQKWQMSHKAHVTEIKHSDGYSASQWYVHLSNTNTHRRLIGQEVIFLAPETPPQEDFENEVVTIESINDDGHKSKTIFAGEGDFCSLEKVLRETLKYVDWLEVDNG